MRKAVVAFLLMLAAGIALRMIAMDQLNWFMGSCLHVDEITYSAGDSPPFERPPGTYLLASVYRDPAELRTLFSAISLIPAAAFFLFREKKLTNSLIAGVLAIEPTLAFSGLQVLPSAPAAALTALSLISMKSIQKGWFAGMAALFRGELLILLPVWLAVRGNLKAGIRYSSGFAAAVLPLMAVNLFSGGPFATGSNGPLNLWLGTSWDLLATPPGLEYEELVGQDGYAEMALDSIASSPIEWGMMGFRKTAAFLSVPGPGRNLEISFLLGGTILVYLLPVTGMALALALAGWKRDYQSALMATGMISAFLFFPSVRHRAVYIPAMILMASRLRWKQAIPTAAAVAFFSIFLTYPAGVRTGLTQIQHSQTLLERGLYTDALEQLEKAEERGFEGADLHNIRGACIASSGGDFNRAAEEFSRALQIAPESPSAWKNMAALLWNYGYLEEAVYAAEKAVSLNPDLARELAPVLSRRN